MSQPVSIFREETHAKDFGAYTAPARATKSLPAPVVRFDYLDGIRALAASYVVLNHYLSYGIYERLGPKLQSLTYWFQFGHYAVDVFIVLSGYCLMLPVARNHSHFIRGGFGQYIGRRAMRILPPYFAALALSLVVLKCIGQLHLVTRADLITHLLLVHNFSSQCVWSINPPLWSVAVEWQIYFAFPLLLLPLRKMLGNSACVTLALLIGLTPHFVFPRLWNMVMGPQHQLQIGWNFDWSYFWYLGLFALGMAVADVTYRPRAHNEIQNQRFYAVAGISMFALVAWATGRNGYLYLHPYIVDTMMGGATAFALAWAGRHTVIRDGCETPAILRLLGSGPLVWVGGFSYSLYLVHVPIWQAMESTVNRMHLSPSADLAVRLLIGFPTAILAAYVFYLAVENPSMMARSKKPWTKSSSQMKTDADRQPLNIFVHRASECLTDYFPNGDGLICYSLLGGLARRGHRIFAYTNRDEVQARHENLIIKSGRHRIPANSLADFEHGWRAGRWLAELEKKERIDLVWRMQPLGESCPMVPYTNGRPLVLGQLFYAWPAESVAPNDAGKPRLGFGIRSIISPLANRGWARTLRAASLVLCTTDALSQQTRGKTSAKVSTLPVIVDPPVNLIADRPRPLSPSSLKLLFVANLFRNKNPLIFCQTIHRLRQLGVDVTGDILGDGPERAMMENWCQENDIASSVRFVGRVSNLEVYRHLSEADGLISTSLGEPYGRSIAEAMSVSAVPICHRSGGPADIIIHGVDGLLVDRLDGNDYGDAIFKIWSESGAWQRLSSAALSKSQQWKPDAVIDRLENALYSVLSEEAAS
jgi:peptidoglycan/LPS O-acetylase OafA/YrhL/glycosyltransferase involved in cell wall biosynthesis